VGMNYYSRVTANPEVIHAPSGLVPKNAVGSRNATGRISREQSSMGYVSSLPGSLNRPLSNAAPKDLLSCSHSTCPRNLPGRTWPFRMLVVLVQGCLAHLHSGAE